MDRVTISLNFSSGDFGLKKHSPESRNSFQLDTALKSSTYGTFGKEIERSQLRFERIRSIVILYVVNAIIIVQLCIYWKSLWPFLYTLDPASSETFSGWITSLNYLVAAAASPVFGYWSGQIKSAKLPIIAGLIINAIGSLMIPYIQLLPQHLRRWALLAARIVCGIGTGNRGVVLAAVAMCSEQSERNKSISLRTAISYASFILGPVIQGAMVPIGYPGLEYPPFLLLNMFTAPSYFAIGLSVIGVALVAWGYKDTCVSVVEDEIIGSHESTCNNVPREISLVLSKDYYDKLALVILGCLVFAVSFCDSFNESVAAPFSMVVFDWTKSQAIVYSSICGVCGAVLGFSIQPLIGWYAGKRVQFRTLLLFGFLLYLTYVVTVTPWPLYPSVNRASSANCQLLNNNSATSNKYSNVLKNITTIETTYSLNSTRIINYFKSQLHESNQSANATVAPVSDGHIPCLHQWCNAVPSLPFSLYVLSYIFALSANAISIASLTILYSSVLGENRQERWMGFYTFCEFFGLSVAPIMGTLVFEMLGPRDMWVVFGAVVCLSLGLIVVFYRRLIPWVDREQKLAAR